MKSKIKSSNPLRTQIVKILLTSKTPSLRKNRKLLYSKALKMLNQMSEIEATAKNQGISTNRKLSPFSSKNLPKAAFSAFSRFSIIGLKLLFVRDLLNLVSEPKQNIFNQKPPSKKPLTSKSNLLEKNTNRILDKTTIKLSSKLEKGSIPLKTEVKSKQKLVVSLKKEIGKVNQKLEIIKAHIPSKDTHTLKLVSLMQSKLKELIPSSNQTPKIRLEVLAQKFKKIDKELTQLFFKKAKRLSAKGLETPSADTKITFTSKVFSALTDVYYSMGVRPQSANQPIISSNLLMPLGIVTPFSFFQFSRISSKKKRSMYEELYEELEEELDQSKDNNSN